MKARGRSDIRHLGVVLIPPPPGRGTHTHTGHVRTDIQGPTQIDSHMYAQTHMGREMKERNKCRHAVRKNTYSHMHGHTQGSTTMNPHTHTHIVPFPLACHRPIFRWLIFFFPLPMSSKQVHMARIKGVAGCMLLLYCQPLLLIRKQDHRQY